MELWIILLISFAGNVLLFLFWKVNQWDYHAERASAQWWRESYETISSEFDEFKAAVVKREAIIRDLQDQGQASVNRRKGGAFDSQ